MGKLEKFIIAVLVLTLIAVNYFVFFVFMHIVKFDPAAGKDPSKTATTDERFSHEVIRDTTDEGYQVYQNDVLIKYFENYDDAVAYAKGYENSSIKLSGGNRWLWDSIPPYNVYIGDSEDFTPFTTFVEAVQFAKQHPNACIYYRKNSGFIWNNFEQLKHHAQIDGVPSIVQYPELYRGCEVTSLAMLLKYKGIAVDKMTLADKIFKDPTPYERKDGKIYYGHPNQGFIGDIYKAQNKGLGVYHQPIYNLLCEYLPNEAIDLTGCEFDDLYYLLEKKVPVWIIINSTYRTLPSSSFEQWETPIGKIGITYKEHSVVITGYDDQYIYINDPMLSGTNFKKPRSSFIAAWEQMGRQAVTYTP